MTMDYPSEGQVGGAANVDLGGLVLHGERGQVGGDHAPDCALNAPLPEVPQGLVGGPLLTHPGCTCGGADAGR